MMSFSSFPLGLILALATGNADYSAGSPPEMPATDTSGKSAEAKEIGPFAVHKTKRGNMVELTLTVARPLSRNYRYDLVISGTSNVRNAGRVGPSARIGATLCRYAFSAGRAWHGTVTITDDAGRTETLRL